MKYSCTMYTNMGKKMETDHMNYNKNRYCLLQNLKVTMTKHPTSFKLNGDLKTKNDQVKDTKLILYDGK